MKKISRYLLLAAVVMAVFAASGCARSDKGAVFDPDQSSIFVKKDGSVLSASVEHSDQNYYSEEELKSFMEGRLSEFNAAQGKESAAYNKEGAEKLPAAIVSCKVEGADGAKTVKSIVEYSSPEMLLALAGEIRDGGGQAGSSCNRQRGEPAGRRRSGGKHVPGCQGKLC